MGPFIAICIGGKQYSVASVELKTVSSRRSLDAHLQNVSTEMQMMYMCSKLLNRYVPKEHVAQVAHPFMVTRTNFCVYICASEVGVVFTWILFCLTPTIDPIPDDLVRFSECFMPCTYTETPQIPHFPD